MSEDLNKILPYLSRIDAKIDKMDARIDKLDNKFDKIEVRLSHIDVTLAKQQLKLDALERIADLNQVKVSAVAEKVAGAFTVVAMSKWLLGSSAVVAVGVAIAKFLVRG